MGRLQKRRRLFPPLKNYCMSYYNTILQKIWRDFHENEAIAFCEKEIKDLKFKVGVLTSDYEEERDKRLQLEQVIVKINKDSDTIKELNRKIEEYKNHIAGMERKITSLKGEINGLEKRNTQLQELLYQNSKSRFQEL